MTIKAKIKTWENMEREYGLDAVGFIDTHVVFTQRMDKSLPANRVIIIKKWDGKEGVWHSDFYDWVVHMEMIEEVLEEITLDQEQFVKTMEKIQNNMENGNWSDAKEEFRQLPDFSTGFRSWLESQDTDTIIDLALLGYYTRG